MANLENIKKDAFEVDTSDAETFQDVLHEVTYATSWREIPTSAVTIYGYKLGEFEDAVSAPVKRSAKEFILSNMDEDMALDTVHSSQMFVDLGDGTRPMFLRDTAIQSMFERAGLEVKPRIRKALMSSNPDAMADILNVGLSVTGARPMHVCICGGKVNGMLSANYNIIGNENVMDMAKTHLFRKFGELSFTSGLITHSRMTATFTMPEAQNDFVAKYLAAIAGTTGVYHPETVVPAVRISSSDCGLCAAMLEPKFMINGHYMSFLRPMKTRHKGGTTEDTADRWAKNCDSLYAKMDSTVEMVNQLAHTTVYYPQNLIQNLCKKLKMPEKWTLQAKNSHKRFGDGKCTMLDIYYSMYDGISGAEGKTKVALEEKIAQVLLLNWSDYDTAVVLD